VPPGRMIPYLTDARYRTTIVPFYQGASLRRRMPR
jgi:hypothetical protein